MKIPGSSPLIVRINAKLQRIEAELEKIDRNRSALQGIESGQDLSEIVSSQTALAIHNVYCGIEQILEDIACDLDGGLPGGTTWHSDLLDQLGSETPLRPAVIPGDILESTRELMRFRGFIQQACGVELRHDDVEKKYAALKMYVVPGMFRSLNELSDHLGT